MLTVKCPHCGAKHDVTKPPKGQMVSVKCGRCKQYFAVHSNGRVS